MAYRIDKKRCLILFCVLTVIAVAIRGCIIANDANDDSDGTLEFSDTRFLTLYDAQNDKTVRIGLEEYVFGVVGGEMPASYEEEAIKAQAVAARTFAAQHMESVCADSAVKCSSSNADICSDSSCCQSWKDMDTLRERWGGRYSSYKDKVYTAVTETSGVIAVYDGFPIEALYHAASGGETEDCENVFSNSVPYLKGVESPGEEKFSHYNDSETMPLSEFVDKLSTAFPKANITEKNARDAVRVISRYESGRVNTMAVGNVQCTGREFRSALSLYSTNYELRFEKNNVVITTMGYGHGVGMSQTGANAMAREGATYIEIIKHYYTGVELSTLTG